LARNEPRAIARDLAPVALDQAAAEGVADTHALALERQIDLALEAEPVTVVGDREALRTLVRNLVDNAVRYTPPGGHVRVRSRGGSRGAVLEVTDSGPGIPAPDRERIFDRFYRRAGTASEGSGLGLAIVKAIADRHGADVRIDGPSSGGLEVAITFPRPP
jgi:two-component system, OmpR family, sensor kinase